MALLNIETVNSEKKWCLDSGYTSHRCARENSLQNLTKVNKSLSLANNDKARINGVGCVKLEINNGQE